MKKSIDVGACFRDSTVYWSQWRVERIFADFQRMPHAVVVSLSDPTESRTIACPILSDKRRFHRIEDSEIRVPDADLDIGPDTLGRHVEQTPDRLGVAA